MKTPTLSVVPPDLRMARIVMTRKSLSGSCRYRLPLGPHRAEQAGGMESTSQPFAHSSSQWLSSISPLARAVELWPYLALMVLRRGD